MQAHLQGFSGMHERVWLLVHEQYIIVWTKP